MPSSPADRSGDPVETIVEKQPARFPLRKIFIIEPTKTILSLHTGLRRAASSVIIQLQTGEIALAGYLGTFGAMDSTDCSCGQSRQSVEHILVACPNHVDLRHETIWREKRETDYRRILNRPLAKAAAQFLVKTRLLGQFRALPLAFQASDTT
jgi:hypothetical protein